MTLTLMISSRYWLGYTREDDTRRCRFDRMEGNGESVMYAWVDGPLRLGYV